MTKENFTITDEELVQLEKNHTNLGKNSDVGYLAVEIAKKYLTKKYLNVEFIPPHKVDLSVRINGVVKNYEIKGTTDTNIAWNKLKVSSKNCYDKLKEGMPILRICNIGKTDMTIYTLVCDEDFDLIPEDRWAVHPLQQQEEISQSDDKKNPSIEDVRTYLKSLLNKIKKFGLKYIILQSGEIHKELNMHQALPTVCKAMTSLGDTYPFIIISQPPKGLGTKLFIKYILQ